MQRFGRTGIEVSAHGLGTMTWGRETDEHEAAEMLELYFAAGGNYLDTAPFYGDGRAELVLAKVLPEFDRDRMVIASRGGIRSAGDRRVDCSRTHLLKALDESLRRMHLEYIDVWMIDRYDPQVTPDELLLTMDMAVRSGRVRYVAVGNYAGWQLAQLAAMAPASIPIAACSVEYSLVQRAPETEVIPAAAALGVALVPWSPLGRGVLTGKYRTGIPADSRAASPQWGRFVQTHLTSNARRTVEAVATAASGLGLAPIDIALAWVRGRGTVGSLLGARSVGQLRAALGNADLVLPDELAQALDDVSAAGRADRD